MKRTVYRFLWVMVAALVLTATVYQGPVQTSAADSGFQIDFIDVGQGDAILVRCDGHYMLVDGGKADASALIYSYLKSNGIKHLDYMVATHPDADHIGGLSGALNYATVDTAYCPFTSYDTKTFASLTKYLAKQIRALLCLQPEMFLSWGALR